MKYETEPQETKGQLEELVEEFLQQLVKEFAEDNPQLEQLIESTEAESDSDTPPKLEQKSDSDKAEGRADTPPMMVRKVYASKPTAEDAKLQKQTEYYENRIALLEKQEAQLRAEMFTSSPTKY